ncbi:MAG: phosphatidylserine decarboxylase [Gammaproteobacteria bacterium]|nr:phosphatidylserine decarboxylase [Gammaproteobacteria bacterium]
MDNIFKKLTQIEQVNFLLTNRIPRNLVTVLVGWFSKIENPLVAKLSIGVWKLFADDLKLEEAKQTQFKSMHDCFIRELKEGVRPINQDSEIVASPCDALIGAHGCIEGTTVFQAKGFPYDINDLIPDQQLTKKLEYGYFVTLRLQSSMYHRFHAPIDCTVSDVNYISGDTWNVNPIALKRVEQLYCKNERAYIELKTGLDEHFMVLVPVAAILVASMQFNCLNEPLHLKYKGPNKIPCHGGYDKGDEMGYFQHGSTIILFTSSQYQMIETLKTGDRINMGEALLKRIHIKPTGELL